MASNAENLPRFHTNVLQADGSTHFIQEIAQFCCSIVVVMGSVSQGLIKLSCAGEKEKERRREKVRERTARRGASLTKINEAKTAGQHGNQEKVQKKGAN